MCCADLLEGHGDAGDAVVVRSALQRREDGEVDLVFKVVHDVLPLLVLGAEALAVENEAGPEQRRSGLRNNFAVSSNESPKASDVCPLVPQRELLSRWRSPIQIQTCCTLVLAATSKPQPRLLFQNDWIPNHYRPILQDDHLLKICFFKGFPLSLCQVRGHDKCNRLGMNYRLLPSSPAL